MFNPYKKLKATYRAILDTNKKLKQLPKMQAEITSLHQKLAEFDEATKSQFGNINTNFDALKDISTDITNMRSEIAKFPTELETLTNSTFKANKILNDEITVQHNSLKETVGGMGTQMDKLVKEFAALNKTMKAGWYPKSEYFEINEELGVFTVKRFRQYFDTNAETLTDKYHSLVAGTDEKSHEAVDLFMKRITDYLPQELPGHAPVLYNMKALFSEDEIYPYSSGETAKKTREFRARYNIGKLKTFLCPIYYESGLVFLEKHIQETIKGSLAIDCGAYWGDTAIIFSEYKPKRVLAFEPVDHWYDTMSTVIKNNNLGDLIEPVKMGVSNQTGTLFFEERDTTSTLSDKESENVCDVTTLDSYIEQHHQDDRVGLIKFDVEGADFDALKGARSIIEKDRPVLLTSIYHDPEHFFDIKTYIDDLGLGYKHRIRKLAKSPLCDLMLISWVE